MTRRARRGCRRTPRPVVVGVSRSGEDIVFDVWHKARKGKKR